MRWRAGQRRILRQVALPVLCSCVIGYFGYHTVQGDRGLMAYLSVSQQLDEARAARASLAAERRLIEHRVGLLRPDGLDLDLLDERARAVLNYAGPDELVFYYDDPR